MMYENYSKTHVFSKIGLDQTSSDLDPSNHQENVETFALFVLEIVASNKSTNLELVYTNGPSGHPVSRVFSSITKAM